MKFLLLITSVWISGCESQLGGCISLGLVQSQAEAGNPYCWEAGRYRYCLAKTPLPGPTIRQAP